MDLYVRPPDAEGNVEIDQTLGEKTPLPGHRCWSEGTRDGLHMGVSENSVPLNPMVNDHYPYKMAIIGNIPYFQTNPYVKCCLYFNIPTYPY